MGLVDFVLAAQGGGTLVRVPPLFTADIPAIHRRALIVARRLPDLRGEPIRLDRVPGLRDRHGPVHAASFLRHRRISFDCTRAEFPRILVHELFHFVWAHAGNPLRWSYEAILKGEFRAHVRGELGWSAEWRKAELTLDDVRSRHRRWREYCCESFCDTAAWLYSGIGRHPEFTLPQGCRKLRRSWFETALGPEGLSI